MRERGTEKRRVVFWKVALRVRVAMVVGGEKERRQTGRRLRWMSGGTQDNCRGLCRAFSEQVYLKAV